MMFAEYFGYYTIIFRGPLLWTRCI